ncbi:YadA-like family protein [Paraburkholderia sp. D1E]|uniref:YadA-like family protein n=1 Tax=Paraburkholderia sp. D1E TaxID=3461398 RepID=UPI00404538DC
MNKSYKTVWNETTGTYVAASETAKSHVKSGRSQKKALVAALLAAGVGFGTAVKAEAAATPNSFAVGVLGTDTTNSDCISSADGAVVTTSADCSSGTGAQQAGIVSYNASGTPGAYFTVTDPNTAHVGAGGVDQLRITNSGLFVLNNLDMGGKKITNLAAGAVSASSTDAVNGAQLFGITNGSTAVNSAYVKVQGSNNGTDNASMATNSGGIAIGQFAQATGYDGNMAVGAGATVTGVGFFGGMAIGAGATATTGMAIGYSASAMGEYSVALGRQATVTTRNALALGGSSTVSGEGSAALGAYSKATSTNSVALGSNSIASAANTVSVGSSTMQRQIVNVAAGTQGTDAVNYAQLQAAGLKTDTSGNATNAFVAYDDTTAGKVTLGGVSGTALTNVAEGALTESSTDAVNGAQLYRTNQKVEQNVAAIAQNTSDISTNAGDITQNTSDIAKNTSDIGTLNSAMTDTVSYDTSAHDKVTLGGASGTKISNVAAGEVLASSSDAVNGSQLYDTNQTVSQNTSDIAKSAGDITNLDTRVTTVEGSVTNLSNQINSGVLGLVQQDPATRELTVGRSTDGLRINMAGTAGDRVVTGVADGMVNASSGDAVNGSQLYVTRQAVAQNASDISTINSQIASLGGGVAGAVIYDTAARDKVSFGGAAGTTLTNVAEGTLSESSTDAVNGSQLYATRQTVEQNAVAIAQNTSDIAQHAGEIAQNTSDIAQNTSDISNLDTRFTTIEGSVSDLTNQLNTGAVGLVQQDQTSYDLTVASSTGGTHVDFTGTAGARELLGIAAGTTSNSAVNLGQLSPVVAALGGGAQVNADGSIVSPTYHMQGGTQTTVGDALDTLDTNLSSLETQINNGSIGIVTQDQASRDLRIGATTDGQRLSVAGTAGNRVVTGVASGAVNAASSDAVNGSQLYANAASTAAALGGGSTVNADGTVSAPSYSVGGTTVNNVGAAIGNLDGRVTQNTSDIASLQTTVGTISGSVANAVQYDSAAHDKVTMGGSADAPKVKLTNLQDGDLSATSTDAVTGAQLWNTNQQLSDLTQSVQNQQQTGSAAMSIDTGGAPAAAATGSGAIAIGGGAQASGDNSVAIGSGSVADQANTVSVGSQGNERRITNVADGQAPTDAVNMRQFQSGVNDVARNAYSGVAAATALTMIPEVDPGKTLAVGVAGATYKGYQAAAVGASARITANVKVKVGAGISGSNTTVGAGASYQW